jgi:recombination protein RecT
MTDLTPSVPSLKDKIVTVRDLILANRAQLEMALPRHLPVDRLIRMALTCFSTTPRLLDATPRSLLGAVIQCAQLGLEPGVLGEAYLVPFRNNKAGTVEVQFIPGYRGLIALARRSGGIATIEARAVHADDEFDYAYGLEPVLVHHPSKDEEEEAGPLTFVYAVCRLKDGGAQFDVMAKATVDKHRDRYSRAAKDGPWLTAYEEMAKKTIVRRLCKMLPASVELSTAVALSEKAELQQSQGLADLAGGEEPSTKGSALDTLAASMPEGEQAAKESDA